MYSGVFPILPTTFDEQGDLDLGSQKRAVDFLIDAGVDGICILANYSEQFALTDSEREQLTQLIIDHVAGRAPVIVTTSHFSTRVAAARSLQAQELGAQMVMLMPPYHGTTLLARLAAEIGRVRYFKVEVPGAAAKLRELIRLGGATIEGPFDGEESITLMADLDAGATGTMPSAMIPEVLGQVVRLYQAGQREEATALYERYLPLINFENKQCGLLAAKALMREGGIIESEAVRHPLLPLHPATRAGLVELARRLDPLILHWST